MKELERLIQREEQKEKKHKKLEQIKKYLKIYEKKFHFLLIILLLNVNLDLIFYHKKSQFYLKSDIFSGPSPGYNLSQKEPVLSQVRYLFRPLPWL